MAVGQMTDQYAAWRRALAGNKLDLGVRGDPMSPPSGFYRQKAWKGDTSPQRLLAIWREADGALTVERFVNKKHSVQTMTALEADSLFESPDIVAVSQELYDSILNGGEWPAVHTTYLRTKDIKAGVAWSEEWSRGQLAVHIGIDPVEDRLGATENARAVVGDNNPPPDMATHESIAARLVGLGKQLAGCLKEWGGKPRTKAEGDAVANFAVEFKKIENDVVARHKMAKQPSLDAGREVDGTWFPIRDNAKAYRDKALVIATAFIDAENAKAKAEADRVNAEARRAAEKAAAISGEKPEPVAEVKAEPVKLGTTRTVSQKTLKRWVVTDRMIFFAHLAKNEAVPQDLDDLLGVIANRVGAIMKNVPETKDKCVKVRSVL